MSVLNVISACIPWFQRSCIYPRHRAQQHEEGRSWTWGRWSTSSQWGSSPRRYQKQSPLGTAHQAGDNGRNLDWTRGGRLGFNSVLWTQKFKPPAATEPHPALSLPDLPARGTHSGKSLSSRHPEAALCPASWWWSSGPEFSLELLSWPAGAWTLLRRNSCGWKAMSTEQKKTGTNF